MHCALYKQSFMMYSNALLSNDGMYASTLIHLLAKTLNQGGCRIREEALQNSTLHVLGSLL